MLTGQTTAVVLTQQDHRNPQISDRMTNGPPLQTKRHQTRKRPSLPHVWMEEHTHEQEATAHKRGRETTLPDTPSSLYSR